LQYVLPCWPAGEVQTRSCSSATEYGVCADGSVPALANTAVRHVPINAAYASADLFINTFGDSDLERREIRSSEAGRLKAHLLKKRPTTTWSDTLASPDWWTLQKLQCWNNAFTPYFRSDSAVLEGPPFSLTAVPCQNLSNCPR
jgi:hypothetical protein